jgi:predicted RNA polymerase sigma factor
MVALGVKRKDEALVQAYAQKVMSLQKRTSTFTQSPFIEFTLAQSFMNQDKNKEALETLKSLDAQKLVAEKRSRQKYLMGSLLMKMKRDGEAKVAFNASIKADKNSAWGKLAKDALGLL